MARAEKDASLQFVRFHTDIHTNFLMDLDKIKLEEDKTDEVPHEIMVQYEIIPGADNNQSAPMSVPATAIEPLSPQTELPPSVYASTAMVHNLNTYNAFVSRPYGKLVTVAGKLILDAIADGWIYKDPSLLASFIIVSFFDLKKFKFHFHTCFPGVRFGACSFRYFWKLTEPPANPTEASEERPTNPVKLPKSHGSALIHAVGTRDVPDVRQKGFFLAARTRSGDDCSWKLADISNYENKFNPDKRFFANVAPEDQFICFADPSTHPGACSWIARNYLYLIHRLWDCNNIQLLCYRDTAYTINNPQSIVFSLQRITASPVVTFLGWEQAVTPKGYALTSREIDMSSCLDNTLRAKRAVDQTLKLIKWRSAPGINLERIKNAKCLLLGAGTLGAYVSRQLLAWGVDKITLADNGIVSMSNPVRQPLYTFNDSVNEVSKAEQSAKSLRAIYPKVDVTGVKLTIPMPGYPMESGGTVYTQAKADFRKLCELFEEHDVVFLLTDSRESRWLPTVMGKAMGKLVMNAAIGFDSFVVNRHGTFLSDTTAVSHPHEEQGEEVGCYYCSDVVAATDSLKDATLEQQCTVTRAGVAPIASGVVVELFSSVLQHPLGSRAPASEKLDSDDTKTEKQFKHPLGLIPSSVRGDVKTFQMRPLEVKSWNKCVACSASIVNRFLHGPDFSEENGPDVSEENGPDVSEEKFKPRALDVERSWEFVVRVANEYLWVEQVTGIAAEKKKLEKRMEKLNFDDDSADELCVS